MRVIMQVCNVLLAVGGEAELMTARPSRDIQVDSA
jgi:hypothetical protein